MSQTEQGSYVAVARLARIGAPPRLGPEPLSFSWSHPLKDEWVTGLGVAAERRGPVEWLGGAPERLPPGLFFGGWAFDAERPWAGFDHERWILPEVMAWWDGRQAWVGAFGCAGTSEAALRARLAAVEEATGPVRGERSRTTELGVAGLSATALDSARAERAHAGAGVARSPTGRTWADLHPTEFRIGSPSTSPRAGERAEWDSLITAALRAIDGGGLDKLVAARTIQVESDRPISESAVLQALEARGPACRVFLLRGREGGAFVGASPELLCESRDGVFFTEALAGTAAPERGEALLHSEKDRREHQAVVDGIREALLPWVTSIEHASTPALKPLADVVHLHTPMRARLKAGVDPLEVARALHPTPAVGGRPRGEAVAWLRQHEPFSRGWYAGAIGLWSPTSVTMAVGLRSARILGHRAELYVGAGVVRGSTPDGEWSETERKAKALLAALGVSDA